MTDYSKLSDEDLQATYSLHITEWEQAQEEVRMLDGMLDTMEEELSKRGLQ